MAVAPVDDFNMPEPGIGVGCEPQCGAMTDTLAVALPHDAIGGSPAAHPRARAYHFADGRLRSPDAQIEARDAASER